MGVRKNYDVKSPRIEKFTERFRKMVDDRGGTTQVAKETDISVPTINFWYNGQRTPDAENLIKLSRTFDVSVDYLLGLTKAPSSAPNKRNAEEYTMLSPDSISRIREAIWTRNTLGGKKEVLEWFFSSGFFLELLIAAENYKNACEKGNEQNKLLTLDYSQLDTDDIMLRVAKAELVDTLFRMMSDIEKMCETGVKDDGKH